MFTTLREKESGTVLTPSVALKVIIVKDGGNE